MELQVDILAEWCSLPPLLSKQGLILRMKAQGNPQAVHPMVNYGHHQVHCLLGGPGTALGPLGGCVKMIQLRASGLSAGLGPRVSS